MKVTGLLSQLKFQNTAYKFLPIDKSKVNKPREVRGYIYSEILPQPRQNPRIISISYSALQLLDLEGEQILQDKENHLILAGNIIPEHSKPIANCYCGYQFGNWAGQLGDGRAISLGDLKNKQGQLFDLQLKGSGTTPFSRFADGNAVLRSSIREFLCSEAMWGLGIPTTRAGSLVLTDDYTERDPFYNRKVIKEQCAVVLRIAPSFLRFGSFEICNNGGPSTGLQEQLIPKLWEYVITHHYPEFLNDQQIKEKQENVNVKIFEEIVNRTAKTVSLWQNYGFCHGVLNTDNMSILGLTIDYGPFGFMEYFNKKHICNHSDSDGRYSYQNQPQMCKWNLKQLANALEPIIDPTLTLQIINNIYDNTYNKWYYFYALKKVGLLIEHKEPIDQYPKDQMYIVDQLFDVMDKCGTDFTLCFLKIQELDCQIDYDNCFTKKDEDVVEELISISAPKDIYMKRTRPQISVQQLQRELIQVQPQILQIQGITQQLIDEQKLLIDNYNLLSQQTETQRKNIQRVLWFEWIRQYKIIQSKQIISFVNQENSREQYDLLRINQMKNFNPRYVLRNSVAEACIEQSKQGNHSLITEILNILQSPFVYKEDAPSIFNTLQQSCKDEICVSCSS